MRWESVWCRAAGVRHRFGRMAFCVSVTCVCLLIYYLLIVRVSRGEVGDNAKEGNRKSRNREGKGRDRVTKGLVTNPVTLMDPPEVTATSSPVDAETGTSPDCSHASPFRAGHSEMPRKEPFRLSPSICNLNLMRIYSRLFQHRQCHGGKNSPYLTFFRNKS